MFDRFKGAIKDIDNSPFFTTACNEKTLQKLSIYIGSYLIVFLFCTFCYSDIYQEFHIIPQNGKHQISFEHISFYSQPFIFIGNTKTDRSVTLSLTSDSTENPEIIQQLKSSDTTIFRYYHSSPHNALIHAHGTEFKVVLKKPVAGIFTLVIKITFTLVSFGCLFVSLYTESLHSTIPINALTSFFCLLRLIRLPQFLYDLLYTLSWTAYTHIFISQARMLFSTQIQLRNILYSIAPICSILMYFKVSPYIWIIFPIIAIYFFIVGKVVMNPIIHAIYLFWFLAINGSIYIVYLYHPFQSCLLGEFLDISIVTAYVAFQIMFIDGEPFKMETVDTSVGNVGQFKMIDQILETLAEPDIENDTPAFG